MDTVNDHGPTDSENEKARDTALCRLCRRRLPVTADNYSQAELARYKTPTDATSLLVTVDIPDVPAV